MSDLEKLRREIDAIDEKIIDLIAERIGIVYDIAKYKARQNILVVDPKREEQIFKRIKQLAHDNHLEEDFAVDLFKKIIEHCRSIQRLKQ